MLRSALTYLPPLFQHSLHPRPCLRRCISTMLMESARNAGHGADVTGGFDLFEFWGRGRGVQGEVLRAMGQRC
jgi:hypothetical protein